MGRRAKGVAITLVALGHRNIPLGLLTWLYSFHLPLFFFLAGYTTKYESYPTFKTYAVRKFRALMIPYLVFGFAVTLFNGLFALYQGENFNWFVGAFNILRGKISSLWFIPTLFTVEVVSYWLNRASKGKFLIALALSFLGYALGLTLPKIHSLLHYPTSHIFWNVNVAFVALFFFWFARAIRASRFDRNLASGDVGLFFAALAVHAIGLTVNTKIDMVCREFGIFPIFWSKERRGASRRFASARGWRAQTLSNAFLSISERIRSRFWRSIRTYGIDSSKACFTGRSGCHMRGTSLAGILKGFFIRRVQSYFAFQLLGLPIASRHGRSAKRRRSA